MAILRVPVSADDHTGGDERALVTMVEYGDYQCPYCAGAFSIVEEVRRHFGSSLRFVFRHFPLTEVHPLAKQAAEAAEFAGAYGRFWQMHGLLYKNQDQLSLPFLLAEAATLGLSETALEFALADEVYTPRVQADFAGGVRSGVNGTPTFFLQGIRHDGPYDHEGLTSAIRAAL